MYGWVYGLMIISNEHLIDMRLITFSVSHAFDVIVWFSGKIGIFVESIKSVSSLGVNYSGPCFWTYILVLVLSRNCWRENLLRFWVLTNAVTNLFVRVSIMVYFILFYFIILKRYFINYAILFYNLSCISTFILLYYILK